MTIIRDDGVSRHIRFAHPGDICQQFDLITWPGYLCYTGDMGTFVFRRAPDMFTFFRKRGEAPWRIDMRYWAEKVEAADRDGVRAFSKELFVTKVRDVMTEWAEGMAPDDLAALTTEVDEQILSELNDFSEEQAYRTVIEFSHKGHAVFQDFHEVSSKVFTQRFTWCCFALEWGIDLYDRTKAAAKADAIQWTEDPDHVEAETA